MTATGKFRVAAIESLAKLGCDTPGERARAHLQRFLRKGNFEEQQAAIKMVAGDGFCQQVA